jgi:addiction module RelE/StbE family toxin
MQILRHKNFKKRYERLTKSLKEKVNLSIERFYQDPFDPSLKNHALKGAMSGRRAISVTGDIRMIFEEYDDYVLVVMLDVGTHNQVYG